jgi:hypothetical protein
VISNSHFSNNHPGVVTGGGGVTLSNEGTSGATTMSITNDTFRDAQGDAILAFKNLGASTQTGTFSGNSVGVAGTLNSGSAGGSGIKLQSVGLGSDTWTVTGNNIHQFNNFGVLVEAGGGAAATSGSVNTTITGNTIDHASTTAGATTNGIHLNIGTNVGDTFADCAVVGGAGGLANSVAGTGLLGGTDIRLRQRQSTTIRLPGYGGSATDTTAVENFVIANNPGASVLAGVNSPPGGGFTGAGSTCP